MSESSFWWLLTCALVAVELLTGTFYLLMIAIGLAAGALAAHAGAGVATQLVVAAGVGGSAAVAGYLVRRRRPSDPSARALRSVNMDIGEVVQIDAWQDDGTASVKYRGANWTAIHRGDAAPLPGPHRVVELVGSRLLVEKI